MAVRSGVQRFLPLLSWTAGYQRAWLRPDVLAGFTVTAILIPEGMAYAQLAGVGPEAAFYAAPAALIAYAVLGTSRQLVVAVSSAVAITSAATITAVLPADTPDYTTTYVAYTAALALLAGLVSIAAGYLRLGRIAQFFSSSVLLGFVFGLALIITMKQVPKLLGIPVSEPEFFVGLLRTLQHLGETSFTTLAVGTSCVAAMVLLGRVAPKLPAALLVLIGSIAASSLLDLEAHGVEVVGELPEGLTAPSLPGIGWDGIVVLIGGALGIALLAFAEAIGPAERFAREHDYEVDANQELVALGASNAGAGLFGGFPIGASLSKSAANDRAGAHTPASLMVAAAATALVALFFTPLFQELPEAALAAIVIVAVADMERVAPLRRLWRLRRADCVLALVALGGVLVFDILPGLGLAVAVSLGLVVWRAGEARLRVEGPSMSGFGTVGLDQLPAPPGLIVVRPEQMLFFVNATAIRDAAAGAVADADPRPAVVLVDLALTPDLDVPGCDALADLRERLDHDGVELWIAAPVPEVRDRLRDSGVRDAIGDAHLFDHVTGALLAFLHEHSTPGTDVRRELLGDLLEVIHDRQQHPDLDGEGREALDAVAVQINEALRQVERIDRDAADRKPDASPDRGGSGPVGAGAPDTPT
ncbi:MAG: SulP family inorganic anion transporter [Acidimicrobiales bacterium]|jgi:high affinity sulfate transporter 1|nr:SulP family inorganic anion transporter [Acidimicrobiales bacterium]